MEASKKLLIYGANGYTAEIILDICKEKNWQPTIAARNETKIKELSEKTGFGYRCFSLDDAEAVATELADFDVVLNCAGPFFRTYKPMLEACLKTNTHYLDITGEIEVFEGCKSFDSFAQEAGVMAMPGVGFDVVPSDCLAAHLKSRLPDATDLELAFLNIGGGVSRGTASTMVENLGSKGAIREDGKIKLVKNGYKSQQIEFVKGRPTLATTIPWGDVSTAHFSTQIPNIKVFTGVSPRLLNFMKTGNYFSWFLGQKWVKNLFLNQIRKGEAGPNAEKRAKGKSLFWGKVSNEKGTSIEARLQTPEGYQLTAQTAVEITRRVLNGDFKQGYQTPSSAYGADLILNFEGVELT